MWIKNHQKKGKLGTKWLGPFKVFSTFTLLQLNFQTQPIQHVGDSCEIMLFRKPKSVPLACHIKTNNEENKGALSEIESLIEKISSQVPLNNTGDIDVLHKSDSSDIPVTNNKENEGALSEIESVVLSKKTSTLVSLNNTGYIDALHPVGSLQEKNSISFLDLEKAFNSISRQLLLNKLKELVFDDNALKWFTSYLSNRQQLTTVGSHFSNHSYVEDYGVTQVVLKAPSRIIELRGLFPDLPLLQQPIITRCGTWLNAVEYYPDNFDSIKYVISHLDNEAKSIKKSKELFENKHLQNNLAYLKIAELVKIKTDFILKKNKGFQTLLKIRSTINGEYEEEEDVNINLTLGQIGSFKYATITSCDMERSFSQYESILRSNRWSFVFENLKQHYHSSM
ncbi:hypothetical protein QTP88_020750 [Uroleucon formosanum]